MNASNVTASGTERMPVVFLSHGGGPWPFVETRMLTPAEHEAFAGYLRSVSRIPKTPPRAVLVISAHWEEPVATVMNGKSPPLLYDYGGFPPAAYELTWPAPGDPALASRVQELLGAAGFQTGSNDARGYDHGTFVPLKLAYPDADMPTVQLSLLRSLDAAEHVALGKALQPLRDEGVFIVGSGMTYHNMRGFGRPPAKAQSEAFDAWLEESVAAPAAERNAALASWTRAPFARDVHPREEHLLPLMVVAGAAGEDVGRVGFAGTGMGIHISTFHFG
jgi:aromatic ring-opening dioxygenase catalytic subunit (LigB family)